MIMRRTFCTLLLAASALLAGPHALVKGVDSIGLTVSDLDRSVDFYSSVLHFQKVSEAETDGEDYEHLAGVFGLRARTARMRLGEEYIELTEFLAPRGRPAPVDARASDLFHWQTTLIVNTADIFAKRLLADNSRLVSPGVVSMNDKSLGFSKGLLARDPDGHVMALIER